jgi:UDP-N-acetylglucosamine--N-acetylmuramyl-(pentapeptide) pyrophosphoryl-undecaprenol N-acetylglucosamine transferase
MSPSLLVAAGGTGGHMFPALAVAAELRRRGAEVTVLTDARGARFATAEPAVTVIGAATPRGAALDRIAAIGALGRGLAQSLGVVARLRPRAAAAFGGYASVPAALAAVLCRVPLLLHEQNAVMGRANRLLARLAARLALTFEGTAGVPAVPAERLLLTGNPVRPGFAAGTAASAGDGRLRLLVLGGSQGARILSDVVPAAVALLDPALRRRLVIAQQCRPEDLERVTVAYRAIGQPVELAAFFDDVPQRMAAADLVVARAGASTIAELLALARPSVLVPYAAAADDHQTANARALERAGAAVLLPQAEATPAACARLLGALLDDAERRRAMSEAAARLTRPDAAARIADALLALAGKDATR